jgi:mercuric ion transport protein
MNNRSLFRTGVVGSVVLAICCVTPVLFLAFVAVGLSAWTGWLDIVLIPALVLCLALTFWAWRRCRRNEACATGLSRSCAPGESS